MHHSLPGSSVHGIFQARILEWVAIPFSRGSSWPRDQSWVSSMPGQFFMSEPQVALRVKNLPANAGDTREAASIPGSGRSPGVGNNSSVQSLSHVWLFATPWTVAHQAPLSMEFSRQEYWNELSFPSPGDLPDPGNEPRSPELQADSLL